MSEKRPLNVLFLCTGNSCRSILAEAYLNHAGGGRFKAFSAGSAPKGRVHPLALETLAAAGIPAEGYASKSWDVFEGEGAPELGIVITTCDSAAAETCPIWPGHPATVHWPFPDPDAFKGTDADRRAHFAEVFSEIRSAIDALIALPVMDDPARLKALLAEIGQERRAAAH